MAAPAAAPVTMPVGLTVAMPVAEQLQAPPVVASLRTVVAPAVTVAAPVIDPAAGIGLTVTARVTDAVPTVYFIVAVPGKTPVTTPEVLTVATVVAWLLQLPPVVASLSEVVAPAHTVAVPVIAPTAAAVTVIALEVVAVPHVFVTL